MERDILIRS